MHDNVLFEYTIVRAVPRVERGEFVNVGVILYCAAQEFLHMAYGLNEPRLRALDARVGISEIEAHLRMFERVCQGDPEAGSVGSLPPGERFRWLAAPRSTVVQTSPIHTGFSTDAGKTLDHLFATLVSVP